MQRNVEQLMSSDANYSNTCKFFFLHFLMGQVGNSWNLRTTNPGFNPGLTPPPVYITNVGGKPRVQPGDWRPEMWALDYYGTGIYLMECQGNEYA
jgi:hypothetical protein